MSNIVQRFLNHSLFSQGVVVCPKEHEWMETLSWGVCFLFMRKLKGNRKRKSGAGAVFIILLFRFDLACGEKLYDRGLQRLEAMLYAVDRCGHCLFHKLDIKSLAPSTQLFQLRCSKFYLSTFWILDFSQSLAWIFDNFVFSGSITINPCCLT